MTARYGEFVRYNPPLEAKTVLIWGAPFVLLVARRRGHFRVARHRRGCPLDDEPPVRRATV